MRLAVVGHSLIHIRQQNFFREVARLGHQVLLVCPESWGGLQATATSWEEGMQLVPLRFLVSPVLPAGQPMNNFMLAGLEDELRAFAPDWVYVQQEPESALARQVAGFNWVPKLALFTWENLVSNPTEPLTVGRYDLVVCGNDAAQERMAPYATRTEILPQVGVDTDHFQSREIPRIVDVAYVGRPIPEKGIIQLQLAYPMAKVLPWVDYQQLPWHYSQSRVVVCFSQDFLRWREQAMPYVACEAMSAGCAVVVSDAGSIPFWHGGGFSGEAVSPAVVVPQEDVTLLREAIVALVTKGAVRERLARQGREWVVKYLSNQVIAQRLVSALTGASNFRSGGGNNH